MRMHLLCTLKVDDKSGLREQAEQTPTSMSHS